MENKDKDDKFEKINKIATLSISFVSLILSIVALFVSCQSQSISQKQFNIDTNESLSVSVGKDSIESIDLDIDKNDDVDFASYLLKTSICFVNTSNLPIYIDHYFISRDIPLEDGSYSANLNLQIESIGSPIVIEPQKTQYVDCYIRIPIPDNVNQYIIEKFGEAEPTNIHKIGEYLFYEKKVDLIGNEIKVVSKDNKEYYKYNPEIPFKISFWTTKGNYFVTEFYSGLFLPGLKYMDEKYFGKNIEISYGKQTIKSIVWDFINKHMKVLISFEVIFIILIIIFYCIKRKRRVKSYADDNKKNVLHKESR